MRSRRSPERGSGWSDHHGIGSTSTSCSVLRRGTASRAGTQSAGSRTLHPLSRRGEASGAGGSPSCARRRSIAGCRRGAGTRRTPGRPGHGPGRLRSACAADPTPPCPPPPPVPPGAAASTASLDGERQRGLLYPVHRQPGVPRGGHLGLHRAGAVHAGGVGVRRAALETDLVLLGVPRDPGLGLAVAIHVRTRRRGRGGLAHRADGGALEHPFAVLEPVVPEPISRASSRATAQPARASSSAVVTAVSPPPTTTTSHTASVSRPKE